VRYLFVVLAACGAATTPTRPHAHDGAIGGIARDHDSGDPIKGAKIQVTGASAKPAATTTTREGLFGVDHLQPGRYRLDAEFNGQRVEIANIDVVLGEATVVDVTFTLGKADPIVLDNAGDKLDTAIDRFAPSHHDAHTGLIEGTVTDAATRRRISGAIVTAILGSLTLQAVSDDQGRFRFDAVAPGTYIVSAYYSVGGRGQIEVRRSDITVGAAEGVRVPLWVETAQ
jgi:hypothetical protein